MAHSPHFVVLGSKAPADRRKGASLERYAAREDFRLPSFTGADLNSLSLLQACLRVGLTPEQVNKLDQHLKTHPFKDVALAVLGQLEKYPVVILSSPTGSGKTTGFPLMGLFWGTGVNSVDVVVPRRGLATETARYVVDHMIGRNRGQLVGINTGRVKEFSDDTKILYETTGTAWLSLHPKSNYKEFEGKVRSLPAEHVFVLDEFDQRQIHVDILLGILISELKRRKAHGIPMFKVVISSATIDTAGLMQGINDLINEGSKTPSDNVSIVRGAYPNGKTINPRVISKKYPGKLGDYSKAASVALEQARQGKNVIILAPNIRIQREMAVAIQEAIGDSSAIRVYQVNAKSTDAERAILSATEPPKDHTAICISTVSRSGGTYPPFKALVDPGMTTICRVEFLGGRLPVKVQILSEIAESDKKQGAGRMGRIARDEKDLVLFPARGGRDTKLEYPVPDIEYSPEVGPVLLSLSQHVAHGHHSPKLFSMKDLPLLARPSDELEEKWRQFLEAIGAVSNQGYLTALGRRMREFPCSLEGRKLMALAQNHYDTEIVVLAAEIAAIIDNEGLLVNVHGRAPRWNDTGISCQSDFTRELYYLHRLFNEEAVAGSALNVERFCRRNDLSYKAFERIKETRKKLLETAKISPTIQVSMRFKPNTEKDVAGTGNYTQQVIIEELIQEAFFHYLFKRPTASGQSNRWTSPLDGSKIWQVQRDSVVNGSAALYIVGAPIGRLEEGADGERQQEDDRAYGKIYYSTVISPARIARLSHKYPAFHAYQERCGCPHTPSTRDRPVKTDPSRP